MLWLRARLGASCAAPFAPDIQKDWLVKAGGSCWLWKLLELVRWSRPGIGFVPSATMRPLLRASDLITKLFAVVVHRQRKSTRLDSTHHNISHAVVCPTQRRIKLSDPCTA